MCLPEKYSLKNYYLIFFGFLLLFFIFPPPMLSLANDNNFIAYQITAGDTLWNISLKYNVSLDTLLSYNNIKEKDLLFLNQIIKIPQNDPQAIDYCFHFVEKGETLWSIAQKYNLKVDSILKCNNFDNPEIISIGQKIEIPFHEAVITDESPNNLEIVEKNESESEINNQAENLTPVTYTVQAGDNLWNIGQKYGIPVNLIAEVNNLRDKDTLSIGQKLEIPGVGGGVSVNEKAQESTIITHSVVKGDTLWSISKKYDVKMSSIITTNNLKEISQLSIGQELKIPITNTDIAKVQGYTPETIVAKDIIYHVKKGENLWSISRDFNVKLDDIVAANKISDTSKITIGQRIIIPGVSGTRSNSICDFIWPVKGRISSPFGLRSLNGTKEFHSGIDISGTIGTNIVAAESGRVSYVGYMRGYGNVIILSHEGGFSSVYAHNSVNLVKKNQSVKKGAIIAKLGKTGNATGPHVHFEIRSGSNPLNPLLYLK